MVYEVEAEFEEHLIGVLQQNGWTDGVLRYATEDDLINNWADILFKNNSNIDCLNGQPLTRSEMDQIIEQIETLKTPLALNSFINGKTVGITRDNPNDPLHLGKEVSLKIYDRKEIAAGDSSYQIVQQPIYPAKNKIINDRRGDLCLLINGMPLIHIELKRSGVPISQASNQIEEYSHEGVFTGIFRLVQIFVAMNPDDAVYFANPGPDSFNPSYYFHWADFNNEPYCAGANPGKDSWKKFASKLLSIPMAHKLIGFYTVADNADGCLKVLRSYQYYAANAISDTVRTCHWDKRPSTAGRPGGYIWHTTGSGKTMTSFKSAQLVADSKDADKVVFLMDRIELGTQSLKEYQSFADDADDVQGTENTSVLRAKLASIDPKDTLIVTSIQKMSNIKDEEGDANRAEIERLASRRIVFIVDECHRSTFGEMLQDIRQSFPNALFFGFTGTPILDENQKMSSTTSMVFGECLHRYLLADGIRDKNVLGFDPYMVATYRDGDVRQAVALNKAKADSIGDALDDPRKAKVYNYYMDKTQVPMESTVNGSGDEVKGIEDFIDRAQYGIGEPHEDKVVDDILDQFPVLSRAGKFHAMLATSSIPEAISYYRLFKERAPQMRVTALFDPNVDNSDGATVKGDALVEIIEDYNKIYGKTFQISTWPAMKKDISSRLSHKKPYGAINTDRDQRIDLLIVVDQMLTGFDSKWVNTLYLDKVIRYESIIQAFSRTNRLFGPDKPFGTIRYYRKPHTMRANIENAVKLYSGDRPLDLFVQKLPQNIEFMDERYQEIKAVFEADGVEDFIRLPGSMAARKKFSMDFVELNEFLDAAQVQGFTWDQEEFTFTDEDGEATTVHPQLTERTYLILVQRYKELFAGDHSSQNNTPEAPYELDGYINEIDTGLIDTDYMNSNFKKWLKALGDGEELTAAAEELHRSFATLSQEDQRLAELFLHDIERGNITVDDDRTLRDYITTYARQEKDEQIDKLVDFLWLDKSLLIEIMSHDLTEANINEFGRFDTLKNSVDKQRAKQSFEQLQHKPMPMFKVNMRVADLLKKFVLEGGFNVAEYDSSATGSDPGGTDNNGSSQ